MKLLGIVLVISASSGIGFLYAGEIKKRKRELEELCNLLKLLLGDIRYMRATLPESVNKAMNRHKGCFSEFLNKLAKCLSESPGVALSDIWKCAVIEGLRFSSLNLEDKQMLIRFGEMIVSSERDTVISLLEQYIEELKNHIQLIHNTASVKVKLYRSLGILAGVFIVILLI